MNPTEPPWDLYRSFHALTKEGSLSAAARSLGLTQPTVARHLDALEDRLGRRLFTRSQRGLSPTEAALAILPYVEALAATSAALLRVVESEGGEIGGSVRITASEVVGIERLPPILAAIRRRYPALTLELAVSNEVEDLLRRDADIAVRMVTPVQEALVGRKVGVAVIGLFAHADYIAQHGSPASVEDIHAFDVIGYDLETPSLRAILGRFPWLNRAGFAFRSTSDIAQLAAIRAGFGIGACQAGIAARDPQLVHILPEAFSVELPTWVVMHEDLRSSPRCRAVFDMLVEHLSAQLD